MKQLVLIRHTKSDWSDETLRDFDRPIKESRKGDATAMAGHLHRLGLRPDYVLCSPALRTRQTALLICKGLNFDEAKIVYDKALYESSADDYMAVIQRTPARVNTLVVIGHNPSITYFAQKYGRVRIDHVPTTGVVWLEYGCDDWHLEKRGGRLLHFITPGALSD
ncbi:MAG: histidine phosphatase family protein [Chitinophagales bacterium]|nr:histidine phosphatase family protein [Chitinophagales bacterium]MDW8418847.1 histidine phosphatase family protein [Chitinophagales bacterium]